MKEHLRDINEDFSFMMAKSHNILERRGKVSGSQKNDPSSIYISAKLFEASENPVML
jgi:hypothetical protein